MATPPAIELRQGELRGRIPQDLIRPLQLADLAPERRPTGPPISRNRLEGEVLALVGGDGRARAGVKVHWNKTASSEIDRNCERLRHGARQRLRHARLAWHSVPDARFALPRDAGLETGDPLRLRRAVW